MGLLCSHWGLSTKTPTQDSLSSVSCCFLGWVPQWDWRLEGKREEEWRAVEVCCLLPIYLHGYLHSTEFKASLQVPEALKLWTKSLFFLCSQWREWEGCSGGMNHPSGSLPAGVNPGPAVCCHWTRNLPSPLSLHYFFSLAVTKILACS